MQTLGLTVEYKDTSSIVGRYLHYFFGLTFLDPHEVGDAFVELMEELPQDRRISEFCDYLVETYIEENAEFPPKIWASASPNEWRTTNGCEAFHSRFNASCPSPHPNIHVFIKCSQDCQTDTYIKMNSLNLNQTQIKAKSVLAKQRFICDKICQYKKGEIGRIDFIKCVSHKFSCIFF
nr:unnamed protein product [Callosobruchus analis]